MHKVSAIKTVRSNNLISRLKEQKWLFVLMLPAFIATLLFSYGPMFGLYMAFTNYQPGGGSFFYQFFHAEFVGFQWFEYFFTTGDFYRVMRNTLATSLLTLFFGFPAPIILALVLNEARQGFFKRFVQTVSYLPHFISWVIAANIVITLLASDGMLNNILVLLGIVKEPVAFCRTALYFGGLSHCRTCGKRWDSAPLCISLQSLP